ncbi:hypothetical protein PGTUg99_023217 [Puccinia graminis f. sp. tritici]|uniref:Uncharacterized protein n=1 Tax=Puccinia graminis f. sp. tritici TaxID=56615 RepID=A0A5B0MBY5_PUCGR|nr:hypothetical protein PGTUg99_023217 [Puccinia graminis f. sp. tritici]
MSMGILNLILLTNWPRRYLCHYPGLFNRPVPDDLLVFVGLGPVAPTIRHSIIHCSVNILINPLIDLFADGISSLPLRSTHFIANQSILATCPSDSPISAPTV